MCSPDIHLSVLSPEVLLLCPGQPLSPGEEERLCLVRGEVAHQHLALRGRHVDHHRVGGRLLLVLGGAGGRQPQQGEGGSQQCVDHAGAGAGAVVLRSANQTTEPPHRCVDANHRFVTVRIVVLLLEVTTKLRGSYHNIRRKGLLLVSY